MSSQKDRFDKKYEIPKAFVQSDIPVHYQCLKGHKRRVSQLNKINQLKTKGLREKEMNSLRYDGKSDFMEEQEFIELQNEEAVAASLKGSFSARQYTKTNFKIGPIERAKRELIERHNIGQSADEEKMMVRTTSLLSSSLPKNREELPHFHSKNLHTKMNHYLNLIVSKSAKDQKEKLKELEAESNLSDLKSKEQQRLLYRNSFLRKLKQNQNVKGSHRSSQQLKGSSGQFEHLLRVTRHKKLIGDTANALRASGKHREKNCPMLQVGKSMLERTIRGNLGELQSHSMELIRKA